MPLWLKLSNNFAGRQWWNRHLLFMSYQNEHPECVWLIQLRALSIRWKLEYTIHSVCGYDIRQNKPFFFVVVCAHHFLTHQNSSNSIDISPSVSYCDYDVRFRCIYTFCISLLWFNASVTDYCLNGNVALYLSSPFKSHNSDYNLRILSKYRDGLV